MAHPNGAGAAPAGDPDLLMAEVIGRADDVREQTRPEDPPEPLRAFVAKHAAKDFQAGVLRFLGDRGVRTVADLATLAAEELAGAFGPEMTLGQRTAVRKLAALACGVKSEEECTSDEEAPLKGSPGGHKEDSHTVGRATNGYKVEEGAETWCSWFRGTLQVACATVITAAVLALVLYLLSGIPQHDDKLAGRGRGGAVEHGVLTKPGPEGFSSATTASVTLAPLAATPEPSTSSALTAKAAPSPGPRPSEAASAAKAEGKREPDKQEEEEEEGDAKGQAPLPQGPTAPPSGQPPPPGILPLEGAAWVEDVILGRAPYAKEIKECAANSRRRARRLRPSADAVPVPPSRERRLAGAGVEKPDPGWYMIAGMEWYVAANEGEFLGKDEGQDFTLEKCQNWCRKEEHKSTTGRMEACTSIAWCPHDKTCWLKSGKFTGNEDTRPHQACTTWYWGPPYRGPPRPTPPPEVPAEMPQWTWREPPGSQDTARLEKLLTTWKCLQAWGTDFEIKRYTCHFKNLYYQGNGKEGFLVVHTVRGKSQEQQPKMGVLKELRLNIGVGAGFSDAGADILWREHSSLEDFASALAAGVKGQFADHKGLTVVFAPVYHFNLGHGLWDGFYPAFISMMQHGLQDRNFTAFVLSGWEGGVEKQVPGMYAKVENLIGSIGGNGKVTKAILGVGGERTAPVLHRFQEAVMGQGVNGQKLDMNVNVSLGGCRDYDACRVFRSRVYRSQGLEPPQPARREGPFRAIVIQNKRYGTRMKELAAELKAETKPGGALSEFEINYVNWSPSRHKMHDSMQTGNFSRHMEIIGSTDVHISGPGTGQMYQDFLPDGAVHIALGENDAMNQGYMEEYMAEGAPYLRALYYPRRTTLSNGPTVTKENMIKLLKQAAGLLKSGLDGPRPPGGALSPVGQVFKAYCYWAHRDKVGLETLRKGQVALREIKGETWLGNSFPEAFVYAGMSGNRAPFWLKPLRAPSPRVRLGGAHAASASLGPGAMSAAEVEEFVKANDLDDGAASALRGCSAEVLRVVLERGDLRGARNPSSALMIRIKEAKANVASMPRPASTPMGGGGDYQDGLRQEVEEFLRQNDVDERAAESLRGALPSVQKVVLGRGDLSGARNPSSALLTRIKDARVMGPSGGDDALEAFAGATQMAGGTDASGAAMFGGAGGQLYGGASGMYGGCGGAMYGAGMQMGAGGFPAGGDAAQNGGGGACAPMPGADLLGQPGYVKMRGLPFSAIKEDVLHFFSGFRLTTQDVVLGINSEGRPSGEAFVRFPTEQSAKDAVRERNRERMDHRYIELFPMTAIEAQRVGLPLQGGVTPTVLSACNQQATMLMAYPQLSAYGYGYMPMGAYGAAAYYPGFAQATAGAAACGGQPCGFGLYGAGLGAGGCAGVYGGCAGAAGMPAAGMPAAGMPAAGMPAGMGACLGGCAAGGAAGTFGEATAPAAGGYGAAATGGVTGGEVRASPY